MACLYVGDKDFEFIFAIQTRRVNKSRQMVRSRATFEFKVSHSKTLKNWFQMARLCRKMFWFLFHKTTDAINEF